jgi:hypothetical protein
MRECKKTGHASRGLIGEEGNELVAGPGRLESGLIDNN